MGRAGNHWRQISSTTAILYLTYEWCYKDQHCTGEASGAGVENVHALFMIYDKTGNAWLVKHVGAVEYASRCVVIQVALVP